MPPYTNSASTSGQGRGPAGGRNAGPPGGAARESRRKRRTRGGARCARGAAMPGRKSSKEKKRRRSRSCCPEGAPGPDGSDRKRRSTESSHGALEVARTGSGRCRAASAFPGAPRSRAFRRQRPGCRPCRGLAAGRAMFSRAGRCAAAGSGGRARSGAPRVPAGGGRALARIPRTPACVFQVWEVWSTSSGGPSCGSHTCDVVSLLKDVLVCKKWL